MGIVLWRMAAVMTVLFRRSIMLGQSSELASCCCAGLPLVVNTEESCLTLTKYSPRNSSILHTKHIFSKEIIKENNELACKRSRALFFVYQIVILIMM
jgi:hypothetical protein